MSSIFHPATQFTKMTHQHRNVCSLDNNHLIWHRHGHNNRATDLYPLYDLEILFGPRIRCRDVCNKVQQWSINWSDWLFSNTNNKIWGWQRKTRKDLRALVGVSCWVESTICFLIIHNGELEIHKYRMKTKKKLLEASKSFANWQAKYKTMSFTCCNFSLFLKTLLCMIDKKYAFTIGNC